MKRILSACAATAALALFSTPASAQNINMGALLNGGEEAPTKVLTGAFGTATVQVDVVNSELTIRLNLFNLPSPVTAGHIHVGPFGVGGPVVINFPASVAGRSGDFSLEFRVGASAFVARAEQGVLTMADAIQSIVAGQAYVNIHTSVNPGGEIRGQLVVRQ